MAIKINTEYRLTCLEDMQKIREVCLTMGTDLDKTLQRNLEIGNFEAYPVLYFHRKGDCVHGYDGNGKYKRMATLEEFLNENNIYHIWI